MANKHWYVEYNMNGKINENKITEIKIVGNKTLDVIKKHQLCNIVKLEETDEPCRVIKSSIDEVVANLKRMWES